MNRIRVFTAFSGYDSQCMALERAGVDYDLVGWSEIDPHAIKAHDAVFPQYSARNYGDITGIDWTSVPDFDMFTYSSPCQDFSKAGLLRGGQEGSNTRSSLLWACREAIRTKRPKYCMLENVDNLVSEKFYTLFRQWEQTLAGYGYTNYIKVMSAMDSGVPQNRRRVFLVSILDEGRYFEFPSPVCYVRDLDRYLEDDHLVEARYHVEKEKISLLVESCDGVRIRQATSTGSIPIMEGGIFDNIRPTDRAKRGRVQGGGMICPTITAKGANELIRYYIDEKGDRRFRRLTPTECFRLQGVSDDDIRKIQGAGISVTQQYRMAGNSICVDVMTGIFDNLINGCEKPEDYLF